MPGLDLVSKVKTIDWDCISAALKFNRFAVFGVCEINGWSILPWRRAWMWSVFYNPHSRSKRSNSLVPLRLDAKWLSPIIVCSSDLAHGESSTFFASVSFYIALDPAWSSSVITDTVFVAIQQNTRVVSHFSNTNNLLCTVHKIHVPAHLKRQVSFTTPEIRNFRECLATGKPEAARSFASRFKINPITFSNIFCSITDDVDLDLHLDLLHPTSAQN